MKLVKHLLDSKGHDVISVAPDSSVFDAIKLMADRLVGSLLVMNDEELRGIVTERDYARKVIIKGRSSETTSVSEIMSTEVSHDVELANGKPMYGTDDGAPHSAPACRRGRSCDWHDLDRRPRAGNHCRSAGRNRATGELHQWLKRQTLIPECLSFLMAMCMVPSVAGSSSTRRQPLMTRRHGSMKKPRRSRGSAR